MSIVDITRTIKNMKHIWRKFNMELNNVTEKLEKISKNYADEFNINRDTDWFIFKLQEELGELTQKYLMLSGRGRKKGKKEEEIKKEYDEEVADVLCHTLLLIKHTDVDIEKAINEKWLWRLDK
jgi:NTP pyrophosphatase (non-canonical NTP hydrolase)